MVVRKSGGLTITRSRVLRNGVNFWTVHWPGDDFVGFRSLCALRIYGMDHKKERMRYKEIRVQALTSSSNRSPWFFNVPGVKHRYTRGYFWVSNRFTCSLVGNTRCVRKCPTRPGIEPRTSGLIVKRFTTTLPHHPNSLAYTFGANIGVVPRKRNRNGLK